MLLIAEQNSLGITRIMPDSQITTLFRKFLADQIKEGVTAAMYTADQLYNQLIDCPWLKRCGISEASLFPFPAAWIQDVDEITRAITSIEWENICLEEHGNISEFLAVNDRAEYRHSWNTTVAFLKAKYLPDIMFRIENICKENKLPSSIISFLPLLFLCMKLEADLQGLIYFLHQFPVQMADHLLQPPLVDRAHLFQQDHRISDDPVPACIDLHVRRQLCLVHAGGDRRAYDGGTVSVSYVVLYDQHGTDPALL